MEKMDLKTRPYSIDMEKKDLKKLTKGQLIKLLLKKVSNHEDLLDNNPFKDEATQDPTKRIKPTPPPRTGKWESVKPKSVPCKSVNEDGYKPIPKPRTDRQIQIPNIKELNRALKGHAKLYEIQLHSRLFKSIKPFHKDQTTNRVTPRGPLKNHERIQIHQSTGGNV